MSRRRGYAASVRLSTDGGVSPNAYNPVITADLRVFAPPTSSRVEIDAALDQVIAEVRRQLDEQRPA